MKNISITPKSLISQAVPMIAYLEVLLQLQLYCDEFQLIFIPLPPKLICKN